MAVREMTGPIGIPDLTAMVGGSCALGARMRLDVPPILNQLDAAIVASASAKTPKSVDALARSLGWPVGTVHRRVPRLLECGALIVRSDLRYVRPVALESMGRIYAIEAKVRDRVAALNQARTYAAWADSYVLVIGPLQRTPLALLTEDVKADRGGLMVGGEWVVRPRIAKHDRAKRLWASEHFFAAIRRCQNHPSVPA